MIDYAIVYQGVTPKKSSTPLTISSVYDTN